MYYGDYKIDEIYEMNEFIQNEMNDFYKLKQSINKGKKQIIKDRYVVLSDIYFLLFDPVPENRHLAKLLFWGDIRQLISSKGNTDTNNSLILEWKNNNQIVVSFELLFENITIKEFMEISSRKIIKIRDKFKVFHDELTKPEEENIMSSTQNYDKLVLLIDFKEELLEKKHSINIIRELMSLYQKIIEILSEKNDEKYKIYIEKLHKMLENKEIQKQLGTNILINIDDKLADKRTFELSNSYYTNHDEEDTFIHLDN